MAGRSIQYHDVVIGAVEPAREKWLIKQTMESICSLYALGCLTPFHPLTCPTSGDRTELCFTALISGTLVNQLLYFAVWHGLHVV